MNSTLRHLPAARHIARRPLILALLVALAPTAMAAVAPGVSIPSETLPQGFHLVNGQVDLPSVSGSMMRIDQHSQGAIIDWGSFSIGANASVVFHQPNSDSVTLNRVVGNDLSVIAGNLNANGHLFLTNPNGVLFSQGSTVNVGGLIASTLALSDDAFNSGMASGQFVFSASPGAPAAGVSNAGTINAAHGGYLTLLSHYSLDNSGTLRADGGTVNLALGSTITVNVGGDNLTNLVIDVPATAGNVGIHNSGTLQADGGTVAVQALSGDASAVISHSGIVRARTLENRNGHIILGGAGTTVLDTGVLDASGAAGQSGGGVDVEGYNVLLGKGSLTDISGGSGGGAIQVHADHVVAMDQEATVAADATDDGHGGSVWLYGEGGITAYGKISARGAGQGDGGKVDTSTAGSMDVAGLDVDASAVTGSAGLWLLDPYDVYIVHGSATGSLTGNPFEPTTGSTIYDGDINAALNANTSVTITTGTSGSDSGFIMMGTFDGSESYAVDIHRTAGTGEVSLRLNAASEILATDGSSYDTGGGFAQFIRADPGTGPMNVIFNSNADGLHAGYSRIYANKLTIATNGGYVLMSGGPNPASGYASGDFGGVKLTNSSIDTRSACGCQGDVTLRGLSTATSAYGGYAGATLGSTSIQTDAGNLSIVGRAMGSGEGVVIAQVGTYDESDNFVWGLPSTLTSDSGRVEIIGIASNDSSDANPQSVRYGVFLRGAAVSTTSGAIDLRGRVDAQGDDPDLQGLAYSVGVALTGVPSLGFTSTVQSQSGNILLSGWSNFYAGVEINGGSGVDAGSGTIIVRAHNDGDGAALLLDGTLTTSGVVNLRPGGVDANGNTVETGADPMVVNDTMSSGFTLIPDDLDDITASTLVLGSGGQTGDISIFTDLARPGSLTLATHSGSILLGAGVDIGEHALALLSDSGDITQTGEAGISADFLLTNAGSGDVLLDNTGNQVSTSIAGIGHDFTFTNAGDVRVDGVDVTSFAAGSTDPTRTLYDGIAATGDVLVTSINGAIVLQDPVAGDQVDLVAGGEDGAFFNPDDNAITANVWRVWATAWEGEDRGGLTGSGTLPNLFGCTYGSSCSSGIAVPETDNHFIYAEQPTATIDLGGSSREYGLPNSDLALSVSGLVFADDLADHVLVGSISTTATQASDVGDYPVTGDYTSPAGYLVEVIPGSLTVTPATLTYTATPQSRVYGDANASFTGSLSGFRNDDTQTSATTGTMQFDSEANVASGVGQYAILGSGLEATNYVFVQAAGNATALTITPATLTYVADPATRNVGEPNGDLSGTVEGFRNDDTLESSTTGSLQFTSETDAQTPEGNYAINGSGLGALNYIFVQADGNSVALTIEPLEPSGPIYSPDVVRNMPTTYAYESNFGPQAVCTAMSTSPGVQAKGSDSLGRQWSLVRSRPNISSCVATQRHSACGDY